MRAEWNERARSDAFFYVASGRRQQAPDEFFSTAELILGMFRSALSRLRTANSPKRRALEIGCGPGRLMLPMRESFDEIHGVDVSDQMIAMAKEYLTDTPGTFPQTCSGSDLAAFPTDHFDYVYSYAVFQHIPSREIVTRYLEEAARVLKPGGVLCCQLRGVADPASVPTGDHDTWTGCVYPHQDVFPLMRRLGLHLLQITGIDTLHMQVVARKPLDAAPRTIAPGAIVKAITPTDNPYGLISPIGPASAFHCWLEGFPEFASLDAFDVTLNGAPAVPCYISDHLGSGGFQLNVLVPRSTPYGDTRVEFRWDGHPVERDHVIRISAYPEPTPQIVRVTDGLDLLAKGVSVTGGLKVLMCGVADPSAVSFSIGPAVLAVLPPVLYDPYVFGYEFALSLPHSLTAGLQELTVTAAHWSQTVEFRNLCNRSPESSS